jgi:hypothetical protein
VTTVQRPGGHAPPDVPRRPEQNDSHDLTSNPRITTMPL